MSAVCLCVCVCVCESHVYACKKTMGDCVSLSCACVLWVHVCEFARAGPSVDVSARDLL